MKRRTLLLLVSLFSSLLLVYQLCIILPDFLEAWTALSQLSRITTQQMRDDILYQFLKVVLGLVFQICFYGAVSLWSNYEATGKLWGSSLTTKAKATIFQVILLIIFLANFFRLFGYWEPKTPSDVSIWIILLTFSLCFVGIIEVYKRRK